MQVLVPCLRAEVIVAGFLDENPRDMEVHGLHHGFLRGLRLKGGQVRCSAEVVSLVCDPADPWADALAALAGVAPLGPPANADPTTQHDVVPDEIDVATGILHTEEHTTLQIRRPLHTWAGLRSFVENGGLQAKGVQALRLSAARPR